MKKEHKELTPSFKTDTEITDDGKGNCFVPFPNHMLAHLGWKVGDSLYWEETEICEDWGEHVGYLLSRKKALDLKINVNLPPSEEK
jgi:hypothetical protein